jgi:hypothetical protein
MALYRQGTASLDANGLITGVDTKWRDPLSLIRTGATIIFLEPEIKLAVISQIISDTEMMAISTDGATVAGSKYVILLNDSLTVDGMAQDVAETLRYYQSQETVIAEAIEFFEKFDLKTLQELVKQVTDAIPIVEQSKQEAAQSAQSALTSRNEAEQLKTETGQIKAETEQLKNDTQTIKTETDQIKTDTQAIKDSALTEITAVKDSAVTDITAVKDSAVTDVTAVKDAANKEIADAKTAATQEIGTAKDSALQEMNVVLQDSVAAGDRAEAAANAADAAKAGAELARDEAQGIVDQVEPENLLKADQNLADVQDKKIARQNLEVDRLVQTDSSTSLKAGDFRIAINTGGGWGALDKSNQWKALAVAQGGTGALTADDARINLKVDRLSQWSNETWLYNANNSLRVGMTATEWGCYSDTSKAWVALDISKGGTGALDAAGARKNLDVYSKSEIASKVGSSMVVTMSMSNTPNAGAWFKIASVTMPQAASTALISIVGGPGFNVGSFNQCPITDIVLRTGNGNPKGLNAVAYIRNTGDNGINNICVVNTSDDNYDVYVTFTGKYVTHLLASASITPGRGTLTLHASPEYSESKPANAVNGKIMELGSGGGGGGYGWVGKVEWHIAAGVPVPGYIHGSGQVINRSEVPDLVRAMKAGLVFITDENTWLSNPRMRGHYTWGDGTNTIRVPDYNGVQSGSYAAPALRGWLSGNDGVINNAYVPNLHTVMRQRSGIPSGTMNNTPPAIIDANTSLVTVTYNTSQNRNGIAVSTAPTYTKGYDIDFNASRYSSVYRDGVSDLSPNAINGVWLIKATGRLTTELEAEPSPVAHSAELESLRNEVAELKALIRAFK